MEVDFSKSSEGLVPAIVQDFNTKNVLMLGYMNQAALEKTMAEKKVTFFSRSKQRLWTKGEESGNSLNVKEIKADCDKDSLLIYTEPEGPVCHKGSDTCWNEQNISGAGFLSDLENIIADRRKSGLNKNSDVAKKSYVCALFEEGINKIAQKVGEEAVEVIIEAKDSNDDLFLNESADLLFHYLILLQAKGFAFKDVLSVLEQRHKKKE